MIKTNRASVYPAVRMINNVGEMCFFYRMWLGLHLGVCANFVGLHGFDNLFHNILLIL